MTFGKASIFIICAGAVLLNPACVEYYPAPAAVQSPQPRPPIDAAQAPPLSLPETPAPAVGPVVEAAGPYDALLAPIALYPDPLIAIILPASTVPGDIAAASNYLIAYGDMSRVDSQPWDPSVRALAHYPAVVTWMAQNMAWTRALGSAFMAAPADVMESVQRLRLRAQLAGTLSSTPQQRVIAEDGDIEIIPAQPDTIYVPVYDPSVVYADGPYYGYGGPFINFGSPYPSGIWLSYCFDWHRHRVWEGDRDEWREHEGWRHRHFDDDHAPTGARPWHPRDDDHRDSQPDHNRDALHHDTAPVPHPMQGAPNPPPDHYRLQDGRPNPGVRPQGRLPPPAYAPPVDHPQRGAPAAPAASGIAPPAPAGRSPGQDPPPPAAGARSANPPGRWRYTEPDAGAAAVRSSMPVPGQPYRMPPPSAAQAPSRQGAPSQASPPAAPRVQASAPASRDAAPRSSPPPQDPHGREPQQH